MHSTRTPIWRFWFQSNVDVTIYATVWRCRSLTNCLYKVYIHYLPVYIQGLIDAALGPSNCVSLRFCVKERIMLGGLRYGNSNVTGSDVTCVTRLFSTLTITRFKSGCNTALMRHTTLPTDSGASRYVWLKMSSLSLFQIIILNEYEIIKRWTP
jgi:hypothetical protein